MDSVDMRVYGREWAAATIFLNFRCGGPCVTQNAVPGSRSLVVISLGMRMIRSIEDKRGTHAHSHGEALAAFSLAG